jgi:hypothetical protein
MQAGQTSCAACGKPVAGAAASSAKAPLAEHVRLLGILWIAMSAIRLLCGGAVLVVAEFLFGQQEFLWALLCLVGTFILALAAAGIATGWGLWQREPWARPLALAVAAVSLLDIPFGTALGVYTLWVLLPAEAEAEYNRLAQPA